MVRSVLIIEDDPNSLNLYTRTLQAAGFAVHTATTIEQAEGALQQHTYALILSDIQIGATHTMTLLRDHVRRLQLVGTRIICMSADTKYNAALDALNIDMFMQKPVTPRQLTALVTRFTESPAARSDNLL